MSRIRRPDADRLLGMSAACFLREHWQKKPLLVRGAFPRFRDPITPDELAGLSCEDGVESRLVRDRSSPKAGPRWEVSWGPQAEAQFGAMPERRWTLLVQEVNRWVEGAALLLDRFAFLPSVRVDDVMVSFAAPGGSVGPHVDSYDVFLVQGRGERRWLFDSEPTKDTGLVPGLDLRILARFRGDVDEVLRCGDMLYLPPGFAHHGVAETSCLTYSVGFRSPSAGEAWASFAAAAPFRASLLRDPELTPQSNPGEIPGPLLARVREMIRSIDTSDDAIDRWFAAFATRLKPGHTVEPLRRAPSLDAIMDRLARGAVLVRSEEARWAYLRRARGGLLLYVGGREMDVPRSAADLALRLCLERRHEGRELRALAKTGSARALLAELVAGGALALRGGKR